MIPEGGGHWGLEEAQGASVRGEDDRHPRGCFLRPMWARRTDRQPVQYLPKRIFWKRVESGGGLCVAGQRESTGPPGSLRHPRESVHKKDGFRLREHQASSPRNQRGQNFPHPPFISLPSLLLKAWLGRNGSLDYVVRGWGEKKLTSAPLSGPERSTWVWAFS